MSYCTTVGVGGSGVGGGISKMLKFLCSSFLCDGQGTVRRAILSLWQVLLQRGTTLVTSCLPPWKGKPFWSIVYSKKKDFAPRGANSYFFTDGWIDGQKDGATDGWIHLHDFNEGKQLLWLPVCFPGQCSPFKIGSTLKGKNLLLEEQILFYKSWPLMKWEAKMKIKELLPLKVFPYTLS